MVGNLGNLLVVGACGRGKCGFILKSFGLSEGQIIKFVGFCAYNKQDKGFCLG